MKIGLIDSGLGGLSFLKGIYSDKLQYTLIMDNDFFPYGNKSKEFLIKRSIYLINYLLKIKQVDKIILACNTLSLVVLPFIKMIYEDKVMGVLELIPANLNNSIFIGTKNSCDYYQGKSHDGSVLISQIQSNNYVSNDIKILCDELKYYDTLILGCTHFIEVKEEFRKYKNIITQDEEFKKILADRHIC